MSNPHSHGTSAHNDPAHAHHRTGHEHGHSHGHVHSRPQGAGLGLALALTLGYCVVEAAVGFWSGSLALLSDAAHMLTDGLALALAALADRLARRPPSAQHSYGLGRAEVIAAQFNALLMLAVIAGIAWHAVDRLLMPRPIQGEAVGLTALLGLLVNLAVAWVLTRGEQTLNRRAALLHVLGDALGSAAALVSGLVIIMTGWTPIDALLSVLICGMILAGTLNLLREATHTLLDGVPKGLSLDDIGRHMASCEGVLSVHDLHVWSLGLQKVALSAHVVLSPGAQWSAVLPRLRNALAQRYQIEHVTLQPETPPETVIPLAALVRPSQKN